MKNLIAALLSIVLVFASTACGTDISEGESTIGLPNPITITTAEEIQVRLGISFLLPKEAEDAVYTIIDRNGEPDMAQVSFTMNGTSCNHRIMESESLVDISGMYYEWTTQKECEVGYCAGQLSFIEDEKGFCIWYDVAPGLLYCVSVESGATENMLLDLASILYVPVQGDV